MPEHYDFGSQDWWGSVFNQFLDPTDPVWSGEEAIFGQDTGIPYVGDWFSGWDVTGGYDIQSTELGSVSEFSNPQSYWEDEWDYEFGSPFMGGGGDYFDQQINSMAVITNWDQWMTDWGLYLPTFNTQDLLDAGTIGALQKNKNIADILAKYSTAGKNIDGFIQRAGNTDLDYLYDAALVTGRLSDFKTQANIFDIQSGMEAEAYGAVGAIASQGAFDWGDINESPYWSTTVVPTGELPEDYPGSQEASPYCDSYCYDTCQESGALCEECWSNCLVHGYWDGP